MTKAIELRDESRAVVTAAGQAQKASDFILGIKGHNAQPVSAEVETQ